MCGRYLDSTVPGWEGAKEFQGNKCCSTPIFQKIIFIISLLLLVLVRIQAEEWMNVWMFVFLFVS